MTNRRRLKQFKSRLTYKRKNDDFVTDESDNAIINIGAENYDDIFSSYCYKGGDTLSSELVEYLQKKSDAVPLDYDLTLKFHVKDATEEKRKDIQSALRENYVNDVREIQERIHRVTVFSIWCIIVGVLFALTDIILSITFGESLPVYLYYIKYFINIFSWIFLWSAVDAFFFERRAIGVDKLKAYRFATARVEIVEFENY